MLLNATITVYHFHPEVSLSLFAGHEAYVQTFKLRFFNLDLNLALSLDKTLLFGPSALSTS